MASIGMCLPDKTLLLSVELSSTGHRAATPSAGPVSGNLHVISVH